jgi:hypothetical protein
MLNPIILFQNANYQQKKIKLTSQIKSYKEEIEKILTDIKSCLFELEKSIPEIIAKHHKLIELSQSKKTEYVNVHKQKEKERIKNIDDETKQNCKELYKEIAKKCHPDITNNNETLTQLFRNAVDKYEDYDYYGLLEISKQLNSDIKTIFEKLDISFDKIKKECDTLEQELEFRKTELNNIKHSVGYVVLNFFNTEGEYSKLFAEQVYSSFLINENVKIIKELSKDA